MGGWKVSLRTSDDDATEGKMEDEVGKIDDEAIPVRIARMRQLKRHGGVK